MRANQSIHSQAAEVSKLVTVAFPTLADADRRAMALEYFTRAWESKTVQWHLLAVAPTTLKEAVQAMEEYLAVSGSEQTLRAMPVEQCELPAQPSALEVNLKAMAEAVTQQTMLLQQVVERIGQRSNKQQKGCFKCGGHICNEIARKAISNRQPMPSPRQRETGKVRRRHKLLCVRISSFGESRLK